jgi:hypothetical protein
MPRGSASRGDDVTPVDVFERPHAEDAEVHLELFQARNNCGYAIRLARLRRQWQDVGISL